MELRPRPLVAIVGRPNVGKSTLFNRFVRRRRAIVEPTPGVTRDRLILPARCDDPPLDFDVMDTGGLGLVDRTDLAEAVRFQVLAGVQRADVVLFLVDARDGLTLLDEEVAAALRRADRPLVLLANKCETREAERNLPDFARLGLGAALPISAQEGLGLADLWFALGERLPPAGEVEPVRSDAPRLAILGRRNTGKSSYVNAVLGEQRVVVSEIPGTTRDAVEVGFAWRGQTVVLVDTAGVHRRSRLRSAIEVFSLARSHEALARADAALLFLDLTQPPSKLDQELAGAIAEHHKPVVVVGTKADLVPPPRLKEFPERVEWKMPHLRGAPVCVVSNVARRGLRCPLDLALDLVREAQQRVGTAEVNRAVGRAFARLHFRGRGEKPRVLYATQLSTAPPAFLLFVNRKALFSREVLRALGHDLRRHLGFARVPVRLELRERERRSGPA